MNTEGIIRYGIPQGYILGPHLFCIFITDLPLHITSDAVNCEMFADDTSLKVSDKNTATIQDELQKSIIEASDWCDKNAMILHPQKQKVCYLLPSINISFAHLSLILVSKGNHIEQVHEHRHLGIITVDEFSWGPHITNTSTVLDSCSDILFDKLNSFHRRSAKLMMLDLSLTTDAKLQCLGLLPLREKLMLNKAVLVFNACQNLAPQYLTDLFICHNSRASSRSMILPKPRIDLFKTSFSFAGASLLNSIPARITSCGALSSFKTQLHKWLRNKM